MARKDKLTEEEAQEIVANFKRVHALLDQNLSGCCEYPLVPAPFEPDENIKKGCSRYCSKCGTYCKWD